jgi:hypothetical protein
MRSLTIHAGDLEQSMTNDTTLSAAACVGTTPETLMLPEYIIATTDAPGLFRGDDGLGLLTLDWDADDSVDAEPGEAGAVLGALDETVGVSTVGGTVALSTGPVSLVAAPAAVGSGCSDDEDRSGLDRSSPANQPSKIAANSNPTTTIATTSANAARTRLC